jgi:hypothetical protein
MITMMIMIICHEQEIYGQEKYDAMVSNLNADTQNSEI